MSHDLKQVQANGLTSLAIMVISDEIRSKKMAGSTQLLRTEGSSFWHLILWQASQQRLAIYNVVTNMKITHEKLAMIIAK